MKKISIIIPVYNCEKYISAAIESIINQPVFHLCEMIIVNDGSTDKTAEICEKYVQEHEHIKLIRQENQGVSVARNVGIQNSSGEYIMFLDADDCYVEGVLDEQVLEELEMKYDAVFLSAYSANVSRNRFGINARYRNVVIQGGRSISLPGTFASGIYRRAMLLENEIWFDEHITLNEDQVFMLKALYAAGQIKFCERFSYIYCKTPKPLIYTLRNSRDWFRAWQKAYQWFDEHAVENREQMLAFADLKISARMLLYAKDYAKSVYSKRALLQELERVNGLEMLQNATKNNVLAYQYKDLELFQNDLGKFILLSKLEGYKIFFGRLALKVPMIRAYRDKKIYPYKKVDVNGPEVKDVL